MGLSQGTPVHSSEPLENEIINHDVTVLKDTALISSIFERNLMIYNKGLTEVVKELDKINLILTDNLLESFLPEEMMIHILQYLPIIDLVKLERVSKNFNNYWCQLPELWKNQLNTKVIMPFLPMNYSLKKYNHNLLYFETVFKPKLLNSYTVFSLREQKKELEGKSNERVKRSRVQMLGDYTSQKKFMLRTCSSYNLSATEGTLGCKSNKDNTIHFIEIIIKDPWGYHQSKMSADIFCFCFLLDNYRSFNVEFKNDFVKWKEFHNIENMTEFLESKDSFVLIFGFASENEEKVSHEEIGKFIEDHFGEFSDLHSNRVQYFKINPIQDPVDHLMFPILYARSFLP